jgi:hypothetical protein
LKLAHFDERAGPEPAKKERNSLPNSLLAGISPGETGSLPTPSAASKSLSPLSFYDSRRVACKLAEVSVR